MTSREIITKAIKHQLLNELFAEALKELHQKTIHLHSERDLDLFKIIKRLATDELLISNTDYYAEKRDFTVIDSSGDVFLVVSPDGHSINSKSFEYYLENTKEMDRLVRIYEKVRSADTAVTLTIEEDH
jgi:hypothetical protein